MKILLFLSAFFVLVSCAQTRTLRETYLEAIDKAEKTGKLIKIHLKQTEKFIDSGKTRDRQKLSEAITWLNDDTALKVEIEKGLKNLAELVSSMPESQEKISTQELLRIQTDLWSSCLDTRNSLITILKQIYNALE